MDYSDIKQRLEKIEFSISELIKSAEADNKITKEEQNIISIAKEKLENYKIMVDRALDDNIVTDDERNSLIDLEEKLMSDIYEEAIKDGRIDNDELEMIKSLFLTIDPKASLEWLNQDR